MRISENKLPDVAAPADSPFITLSQAVGLLSEPFDGPACVEANYAKWQANPESKYYGKTKEQILRMWDDKAEESRGYGKKLDSFIGESLTGDETSRELWALDNDREADARLDGICRSFEDFMHDMLEKEYMEFVCREKDVYLPLDGVTVKGRLDALFRNTRTGRWIVIDWKSSDHIDKVPGRFTGRLLGPASQLYDLDNVRYTIQTHFYKMALLRSYLPEGTKPEDVATLVVDLGGHAYDGGVMYDICGNAMPYDEELLTRIFTYAHKKHVLLKKKEQGAKA